MGKKLDRRVMVSGLTPDEVEAIISYFSTDHHRLSASAAMRCAAKLVLQQNKGRKRAKTA